MKAKDAAPVIQQKIVKPVEKKPEIKKPKVKSNNKPTKEEALIQEIESKNIDNYVQEELVSVDTYKSD